MLRIAHVDLSDELVIAADERWPNSTWSAVLDYALSCALEQAARDDDATDLTADVDVVGAPLTCARACSCVSVALRPGNGHRARRRHHPGFARISRPKRKTALR